MAQQWYTVPESKVWRSADGKKNFWFYAGDTIPTELAVRMQMPGAVLPDPDPLFSAAEQASIAQLAVDAVGSGGGGAVPSLLPTFWSRRYTNRTAGAGVEASYTIFPSTLVGGLVRVEEAGMQITTVGVRVTTGAADATARLSVYGLYEGTDSTRGLAGTRLVDCGTVSVATAGYKNRNAFIAVEPGLYWIMVEPSAEITIAGFQSHVDHLGTSSTDGTLNSGITYNVAESMATHPASLNGGEPAALAPLVYFQLDTA